VLSLAAGTVLDVSAAGTIEAARTSGFDGCGLRLTPEELAPEALRALRTRLDDSGLSLLDVEVVRLRAGDDVASHLRLLDAAAVLGAGHVLAVSEHAEHGATVGAVSWLGEQAAQRGVRVALEFMVFTSVRSLDQALRVIAESATGNVGVLVDALHLHRSGGTPSDLGRIPPGGLAYLQLCDAGASVPTDPADEARHHRLLPGDGGLPLVELVAAAGGEVPISVEVQSDELVRSTTAEVRAGRALAQTRALLGVSAEP
jgi:sugar phosphate isomerase/epimerase